jgi:hypothetical protein
MYLLQIQEQPKLITEQEDVHLIESFLIGTKENAAGWKINNGNNIQDWVGKDFVMIPEKIFDPNERQPGHPDNATYEEDMAEIKKHSHGKIVKVKGPYNYEDGSNDYYYKAVIKLKDSLSASALVENGNRTWVPFAVSPQIYREEGPRDNITKYKPMALVLVIKGAYGESAVVEKMCSGSALKCGTSLKAAIDQLNHDTTDQHLSEVLTSYISVIDKNKVTMSAQEVVQPTVPSYTKPEIVNQPVNQPVELKKEEIISKEQVIKEEQERKETEQLKAEVEQLKKERNEEILNNIFGSIQDQEVKTKVLSNYTNLKDARIVKQAFDDFNTHILPKAIEAKLKESKNVKDEVKSEKASTVLKPEPKIDKNESLSASIDSDDLSISACRSILGL